MRHVCFLNSAIRSGCDQNALPATSPADLLRLQESLYALGRIDTLELNCIAQHATESNLRTEGTRRFPWMQVQLNIEEL